MELITILRSLWRVRFAVAVVALLSLVAGIAMAFRISLPANLQSRHYEVGIGSSTALVDTPKSQVVDLGGANATTDFGTLSGRATLLASLMTSSPIKDEIAARAGIAPEKLIAIPPASPIAGASTGASVSGATVSPTDPKANILRTNVPSLDTGQIPIITVNTQAADAGRAGRLANAAITVLQSYLQSQAGRDNVPDARRVIVRQLGPARSTTVTRGPRKIMGVIGALAVFMFGCAAILGFGALVRGWREADRRERLPESDEDIYEDEDEVFEVEPEPEPYGEVHELPVVTVPHAGDEVDERRVGWDR
jgi:hypothetical protein